MTARGNSRDALMALSVILLLGLSQSACHKEKPHPQPAPGPEPGSAVDLREEEDPFDRIYAARLEDGRAVEFNAERLAKDAVSREPFDLSKPEKEPREQPPDKLHPRLRELLRAGGAGRRERIIVNFRDDFHLPRFPEPAIDGPRDSAKNEKALARTAELIRQVEARRAEQYERQAAWLTERHGAKVLDRFWLINALLVDVPLDAVRSLAEREEVLYLEPEDGGEWPPQNGNNNDDVQDGRARMVSDPYFGLGLTGGFIGLLDTGMRFTHTQFNSPSHVVFRRDCVNGGSNCNTGSSLNPNDDCWDHGTSSGAIITANANQGDAFRGVTGVTLDSFKVYPTSFGTNGLCNGSLNGTAVVQGFQSAIAVLDRVIVAEMQSGGNDASAIATAADNAFDAGAVVIAANGNNGPNASTVNGPAIAHKVIGVGNFDVQSQTQVNSQSRGPAPDNRFKPDIQAPTNTETADNGCGWQQNCATGGSNTAFRVFGGTSGATPYAAGAAALLRNWLRGTSFSIDPGQVYAQLILSGQQPYPFNNTSGAGPLRLPTDGWAWWGKVSVQNRDTIDIPISIPEGRSNTLDGALWWPETVRQTHNDVDLHLVDPAGSARAASISIPSVFERARVAGAVAPGRWRVRIRGFNVASAPQTVYWAAHVRLR